MAHFGTEEQRKRWLKIKYIKSPLFVRPFINFTLKYILKGEFLDGKEGFIWHILQGFWYRMLVDAKIFCSIRLWLQGTSDSMTADMMMRNLLWINTG